MKSNLRGFETVHGANGSFEKNSEKLSFGPSISNAVLTSLIFFERYSFKGLASSCNNAQNRHLV